MESKKKVGILTTFGGWDEAYSPVNVVKYQLYSLKENGYDPVLFTLDVFPADWAKEFPQYELRNVLPTTKFEPYADILNHKIVPPTFERDVEKIKAVYEKEFADIDVLLCHDVIFQHFFLPYNAALHKAKLPSKLWMYHWMHSGPSDRKDLSEPLSYYFTLPPQSTLVYMNGYDTTRAAEMYAVYAKDVRVVHNPINYRVSLDSLESHTLFTKINERANIYSKDIIGVYPLSTTRMGAGGKQLDKAIKIMGYLKQLGSQVLYIVPNAHANGENEKLDIQKMIDLGEQYELTEKDLVFTSTLGKAYEHGVKHDVVLELFKISDVFLFPSVSENCPLALLEAGLSKNLMVLNEDFSGMKDFVGSNALYFKFSSI